MNLNYQNALDASIIGQFECYPMPVSDVLPELSHGRRLIVDERGMWLQCRSRALSAVVPIQSHGMRLPYGKTRTQLSFAGGPVPFGLIEQCMQEAAESNPEEWAGVMTYTPDTGYDLHRVTTKSRSAGHISYLTNTYNQEDILLDLHSHGKGEAYFSSADDVSDMDGIHLSVVFGRCDSVETMTCTTRLCVYGMFFELNWQPWEAIAEFTAGRILSVKQV